MTGERDRSYFFQRAPAAFAAISFRRSGVKLPALASPPFAARSRLDRFTSFSPVTLSRMDRAEESDSSAISSGSCSLGGFVIMNNLTSDVARVIRPCYNSRFKLTHDQRVITFNVST
jgi:hypothetical protein